MAQLREDIEAFEVQLSPECLQEIDAVYRESPALQGRLFVGQRGLPQCCRSCALLTSGPTPALAKHCRQVQRPRNELVCVLTEAHACL